MFEVLLSFGYDDLNATPKVKLGCLEILEKGPFFVSKKEKKKKSKNLVKFGKSSITTLMLQFSHHLSHFSQIFMFQTIL